MSYLVFARKWRPQTFEEVVGQEHVTTTLKNAILSNRVAHAYLFSGPRGVGKTTTARIFAKALNCQSSDKPVPVPCNKCESCLEITQGRSLDVIEIDGASNRGIDEIRQLRENVKFGASKSRYKVYIIDEVHQITQDGFNALLKTLEEPPPHVKFIFATTHKHKVIPTILSRCQRFDFKKISTPELVDKLKSIVASEKLKVDEEALFLVARAADGSVRDAESILDQVVSFSTDRIRTEDVVSMLGSIEQETFFDITEMLINRDAKACLNLINKFVEDGKDLFQFVGGLLEHFRNLAIAKVQSEPAGLIDLPKDVVDKIYQQSKSLKLEDILNFFNTLNNTQELMRKSGFSRIQLEIAVIKLIKRDSLAGVVSEPKSERPAFSTSRQPAVEAPRNSSSGAGKTPGSAIVDFASQDVNLVIGELEVMSVATVTEEKPQVSDNVAMIVDKNNKEKNSAFDEIISGWQYVLNGVKSEKISAALFLMEGTPSNMDGATLIVNFPSKYVFYKEALERNENRCIIEKYLKSATGADVKVKFVIVDEAAAVKDAASAASQEKKTDSNKIAVADVKPAVENIKPQSEAAKIKAEPIVESAIKIFRGRVARKE